MFSCSYLPPYRFLDKYLFNTWAHFVSGLFCFHITVWIVLYIFCIPVLYQVKWFTKIFSQSDLSLHSLSYQFFFLTNVFWRTTLIMMSNLSICYFMDIFGVVSKRSMPNPKLQKFSPQNFIVLGFTFYLFYELLRGVLESLLKLHIGVFLFTVLSCNLKLFY